MVLPAIGQDAPAIGSPEHSTITAVAVTERDGAVDVDVTFSELVQPAVKRLEHPDRLVFDFPECDLAEMAQHFVVNRGSVLAVSTEVSGVARPVARVVIDLAATQKHGQAAPDNKLVVNLSASGNTLTIELSSTGTTARPALTGRGKTPATKSQPPTNSARAKIGS